MRRISWSKLESQLGELRRSLLTNVDEFGRSVGAAAPSDWRTITDWEGRTDVELIGYFRSIPDDELVIVAEACYTRSQPPMIVERSQSLIGFASEYLNEFGESVFNGDLFIFAFASKYAGVFHHEGLYYEGRL